MVNMNGQYIIKIVISHEKFALQTEKKTQYFFGQSNARRQRYFYC